MRAFLIGVLVCLCALLVWSAFELDAPGDRHDQVSAVAPALDAESSPGLVGQHASASAGDGGERHAVSAAGELSPNTQSGSEAKRPVVRVAVRVVDAANIPVGECEVSILAGWRGEFGVFRPVVRGHGVSDEDGLTSYYFDEERAKTWCLLLWARAPDGRTSPEVPVASVIPGVPHVLRLGKASSIRLQVLNEAGGDGVAGSGCSLHRVGRHGQSDQIHIVTGEDGIAHFKSLAAGDYTYNVQAPHSRFRRHADISVGEAEDKFVEIAFADETYGLAASGRFVGGDGERTTNGSLVVGADLSEGRTFYPDSDGYFACYTTHSETVILRIGELATSDRFEPQQVVVPFGTTGLVFRNTGAFPLHTSRFRVLDAASKNPILGAIVRVYLQDAYHGRGSNTAQGMWGTLEIEHAVRPDLRFVADAPNHQRVSDWVVTSDDVIEVRLWPGHMWDLDVVDASTGQPIADAVLTVKGQVVGRSDGSGRAHVEHDEDPKQIIASHPDYLEARWWPASLSDFVYMRAK
ncbi:MAG: hypothetical protein ACI841_004332 [Planctomycetota bacterium]|jgi:hypothetical protein